jgi:FixJ family two-component response regulator
LSGIVYDDDASFRTAIQQQLEKSGYSVVTYASAEQVLSNGKPLAPGRCRLQRRFLGVVERSL